jgi:hypothetical protein
MCSHLLNKKICKSKLVFDLIMLMSSLYSCLDWLDFTQRVYLSRIVFFVVVMNEASQLNTVGNLIRQAINYQLVDLSTIYVLFCQLDVELGLVNWMEILIYQKTRKQKPPKIIVKKILSLLIDLRWPKDLYVNLVCPSVSLSVCTPVRLSFSPSVLLSVCTSVRLSVRLSACPPVRMSVCPSVRLSVCPFVRPPPPSLSLCLSVKCE